MSVPRRFVFKLWIIVSAAGCLPNIARPQAESTNTAPCSHVEVYEAHPISNLRKNVQAAIRKAVRSDIQAIMNDPGYGVDVSPVDKVPLNAVRIPRPASAGSLYIVSWGPEAFKSNRGVWIVELTQHGARPIKQTPGLSSKDYLLNGFGFESLSPPTEPFPVMMFASKGYKGGGGAEAEEYCVRQVGAYYQPIACPATCHEALNAP